MALAPPSLEERSHGNQQRCPLSSCGILGSAVAVSLPRVGAKELSQRSRRNSGEVAQADWPAVDKALGRSGTTQPDGVRRYSFPRFPKSALDVRLVDGRAKTLRELARVGACVRLWTPWCPDPDKIGAKRPGNAKMDNLEKWITANIFFSVIRHFSGGWRCGQSQVDKSLTPNCLISTNLQGILCFRRSAWLKIAQENGGLPRFPKRIP